MYFIDNDSARDFLIRGSSKSIASFVLLSMFHECESEYPSYPWFNRVPSYSNPADPPSRGDIDTVSKQFNLKYEGPIFLPDEGIDRILRTTSLQELLQEPIS